MHWRNMMQVLLWDHGWNSFDVVIFLQGSQWNRSGWVGIWCLHRNCQVKFGKQVDVRMCAGECVFFVCLKNPDIDQYWKMERAREAAPGALDANGDQSSAFKAPNDSKDRAATPIWFHYINLPLSYRPFSMEFPDTWHARGYLYFLPYFSAFGGIKSRDRSTQ